MHMYKYTERDFYVIPWKKFSSFHSHNLKEIGPFGYYVSLWTRLWWGSDTCINKLS